MKVANICPFRGDCVTNCQLFVPSRAPEEGKCALAYMPLLKQEMVSLNQTIVSIGRVIPVK